MRCSSVAGPVAPGSAGVLVDGKVVVRDGRLARIDEDAVREQVAAALAEFALRLSAIEAHAARLEPHCRRSCEKAPTGDVAMSRWASPFAG